MAYILHIETSSPVCSVSIAYAGKTISAYTSDVQQDHIRGIAQYIQQVCDIAQISLQHIQAVAISAGPGSYTGLRIGTSIAKGICHALNIPLITISTLEAMIDGVKSMYADRDVVFCPLLDARRMEVYTMVGTATHETLVPPHAYVIVAPAFTFLPENRQTICFGSGLTKSLSYLPAHAEAFTAYNPSSEHLHSLAFEQFSMGIFADLPYFEPEYLKEFYTPAKKHADK